MRVSDLAKELNISAEVILEKLKSLRLKAKGAEQELNTAVVSVLRSELRVLAKPAQKPLSKAEKESQHGDGKLLEKEMIPAPKVGKESKATKVVPREKKVAKPALKAKEEKRVKGTGRPQTAKPFLSDAPFVTLKPLPKKRRKKGSERPGEVSPSILTAPSSVDSAEKAPTLSAEKFPTTGATAVEEIPRRDLSQLIPLEVRLPITVKDLAVRLQQKPSIILKQLMQKGMLAHINQSLEEDVVRTIAEEFGFSVTQVRTQEQQLIEGHKKLEQDSSLLKSRAPVVTLMGHVDHGKTSLLDWIRKSKVADSEHGGITQHIGAYSVQLKKGRITFLDTPGHEAFTAMRARGAHITDIVVLVVAADEGVMPQTEEALDHARAAGVPIVVALNKIDKKNADIDQVKKQLSERGLNPEDWGGKTIVAGVSALTGEGVDHLLEMIILEAELLELKSNPDKSASGIVVEARLSGVRGTVADLIVQSGTLREGDIIAAGPYYGRVKAMFDDRERPVKEAGPSMPVEVLGLPGVPEAGEAFYVVEDERQAREITSRRQEQLKTQRLGAIQKFTLEDLYSQIQEGSKELNIIVKADVQGSLEALKDSIEKIPSAEIKIRLIHLGVGDVNLSDVLLAVASKAIIMAFHVGVDHRAQEEFERHPVDVRQYRIIYDAVNDIKKAIEGLLEPKTRRKLVSRIEVRQIFKLSKAGTVAGCYIQKGKIHRKDQVDVLRNGKVVFSGNLSGLKRFKDDVREVNEGMECGLTIQGFDQFETGDVIEAFELEQIARKL